MVEMKFAFLLPFMGPLPSYFPFWAKSCEFNKDCFHWFVYSDQVETKKALNDAVTIIPYCYSEMIVDFKRILGIEIYDSNPRMLCTYRLLFYSLRRDQEPLDQYDFIGYTDMDMIYGDLSRFIPEHPIQYTVISADPGQPCGPFTLVRLDRMKTLSSIEAVRNEMTSKDNLIFDESEKLLNIIADRDAFWCQPDGLQPAMTPSFNHRKIFSIWKDGRVTICDNRGHRKEGGFHHFSRYKDSDRFVISADPDQDPSWVIYKNGIKPVSGRWSRLKVWFSMML